jgi:hypothetical protein
MRALAVSFAEKGYHVFRLAVDSKKPVLGSHWKADATNDVEIVRKWWTALDGSPKDWNIGIRCRGICAFDFDVKGGRTMIEHQNAVIEKYGRTFLQGALITKTPSGGRHAIFRLPEGMRVPSSVGKLFPGVDIRGDDGYIVAPGSHIPAGGYALGGGQEWMPVAALAEAAALDDVLAAGSRTREWAMGKDDDRVAPKGKDWESFEHTVDTDDQIETARAWLRNEAPEAVQRARGRDATIRVIQSLGDMGLTADAAVELLFEEAAGMRPRPFRHGNL